MVHFAAVLVSLPVTISRGPSRGVAGATASEFLRASHVECIRSFLGLVYTSCIVEASLAGFQGHALWCYETSWVSFQYCLLAHSSPRLLELVVLVFFLLCPMGFAGISHESLVSVSLDGSSVLSLRLLEMRLSLFFAVVLLHVQ